MKTIVKIGLIVVLFGLGTPVLAQDNVGLLPTNPFYFLKEWGRSFRKAITLSSVKKTELALKIIDEKIAELKKLADIFPDNANPLLRAVNNYTQSVERLRTQWESLKETSANPNVDWLISELLERALRHYQLFDELTVNLKAEIRKELSEELTEAQEKLGEVIAAVPKKLKDAREFRNRFEEIIFKQDWPLKELRAAEAIDRFENKLDELSRKEILRLKEDLLLRLGGRLEIQGLVPELENLPSDLRRRLEILDEIREQIVSPELKSKFNILRQRVLDKSESESAVSKEEAEKAIESAKKLIADLEAKISELEGGVFIAIQHLLERSRFNINQAETLLSNGNYVGAFGQATAAGAAARNALNQLSNSVEDLNDILANLKKEYDELLQKALEKGLTAAVNPKLFGLFGDAEKKITETSQLIQNKAGNGRIISAIRAIKLLFGAIDALNYEIEL
jgi:hypothetical protein